MWPLQMEEFLWQKLRVRIGCGGPQAWGGCHLCLAVLVGIPNPHEDCRPWGVVAKVWTQRPRPATHRRWGEETKGKAGN